VQELRPGLFRWTAPHPDWEPDAEPDSPADWPQEVGCVAYRAPRAFVLIDPLVTDGWEALDELVAEHGEPVHVLTTIEWHARSSEDAVARYGAATDPPAGVEPIPIERAAETLFWIPEHRALVPGDRIIGFGGDGPLRLCPQSWLRSLPTDELRAALRIVLDLPVELVLVSHGEPVLEDGHAALTAILADHAQSSAATAR
jgi:hypothetical protein